MIGKDGKENAEMRFSDNGPAYVTHDTQNFARMMRPEVARPLQSGVPTGMVESFVKTFQAGLYIHMNPLNDAKMVLEKIPEWLQDYNEYHPHKELKMKSPLEYRRNQLS